MHETRMVQQVIRAVERAVERERRVVEIRLRIGALSHVTPASFEDAYRVGAQGTPVADARLVFTVDEDPTAADALDVRVVEVVVDEGAG